MYVIKSSGVFRNSSVGATPLINRHLHLGSVDDFRQNNVKYAYLVHLAKICDLSIEKVHDRIEWWAHNLGTRTPRRCACAPSDCLTDKALCAERSDYYASRRFSNHVPILNRWADALNAEIWCVDRLFTDKRRHADNAIRLNPKQTRRSFVDHLNTCALNDSVHNSSFLPERLQIGLYWQFLTWIITNIYENFT